MTVVMCYEWTETDRQTDRQTEAHLTGLSDLFPTPSTERDRQTDRQTETHHFFHQKTPYDIKVLAHQSVTLHGA